MATSNQEVMVLSDLTVDLEQFRQQFNNYLSTKNVWKGELTTQTSQTLIDLISTIGTFDQAKIIRAKEDAYSETAQSDDAIRSITQMQGLRMTRMLPAEITVELSSQASVTIAPYTVFMAGGYSYFNREQIILNVNDPVEVSLYEGRVQIFVMGGLGTSYQAFVSEEAGFVVSDSDVVVRINNVMIPRSLGTMWNYREQPAFSDLTLADGRLIVQFGSEHFGSRPEVNDIVSVMYVVTEGSANNNRVLLNKRVTTETHHSVSGKVLSNPTGGTDQKSVIVYKNVSSGSFGTYQSGVTKSQYTALVNTYPGVVDAVTQAQREINPGDLFWMNTIRVSALTNSPWTQNQQRDFIQYLQKITMYAARFIWQDAIPIDQDVQLEVYAFNTAVLSQVQQQAEDAITELFRPKPGILMTDFYASDLIEAVLHNTGNQVSYVQVVAPTSAMLVTAPSSPTTEFTVELGGTLSEQMYAYCVSVTTPGDVGTPNGWVYPQIAGSTNRTVVLSWDPVPGAIEYKVWGREAGHIGLLATITNMNITKFVDDGTITPVGGLPNTLPMSPIRYNRLRDLQVSVRYASRQQRMDGTPQRNILGW